VRRGDIIAIFAGETHWWYSDGNEPLQIVSIVITGSPHKELRCKSYHISIPTD